MTPRQSTKLVIKSFLLVTKSRKSPTAFVLEKYRGSTSNEKGVEADDEVCIDSRASIHIERKRLSTSKWIKPNNGSATKVNGIDQLPLCVTHSGVVPGYGKVFVVPECGSDI